MKDKFREWDKITNAIEFYNKQFLEWKNFWIIQFLLSHSLNCNVKKIVFKNQVKLLVHRNSSNRSQVQCSRFRAMDNGQLVSSTIYNSATGTINNCQNKTATGNFELGTCERLRFFPCIILEILVCWKYDIDVQQDVAWNYHDVCVNIYKLRKPVRNSYSHF